MTEHDPEKLNVAPGTPHSNILSETEFNAYMQTEGGKTYYQIVDWRLRSIQFLTLPSS